MQCSRHTGSAAIAGGHGERLIRSDPARRGIGRGRRGDLVQDDGAGRRGGDVADGITVPGVDGLGSITARKGIRGRAGEVARRGYADPTCRGKSWWGRNGRNVVAVHPHRVGSRER